MTDDPNPSVQEPRAEADVCALLRQVRDAVSAAASASIFERLALCHNTRRMWWQGQTDDGRLPELVKLPKDRRVFTWAGAPDVRVPKADEIVCDHAMLRGSVWSRGEVRLAPRETEDGDGRGDEDLASAWQTTLDFFLDLCDRQISSNLALFDHCVEEFGYGIIHVGWRRKGRIAKRTVTFPQALEFLTQRTQARVIAAQEAEGTLTFDEAGSPAMTPDMVQRIQVEAQAGLERLMLDPAGAEELQALLMQLDPAMTRSESRHAAAELRRTSSAADYYVAQDDGGLPFAKALVPFVNVVHGTELTGDGEAPWFAVPEWLYESDLRERAAAEEWDEKFLEAVMQKPNQGLVDTMQTYEGRVPEWALNGAGVGMVVQPGSDQEKLFQVVYLWRKAVNRDGLPMVYSTLLHPQVEDMAGFDECTGLAELPFHVETREPVSHAVQSRGIPLIVVAAQNQIKDLMDAEGARAQLGSNPPLNRAADGSSISIQPGVQIFRKRNADAEAFLQVPRADEGSLLLMDRVNDMIDRRFFRSEKSHPDMVRLHRESIAMSAARSLKHFVRLLWKTIQGNVSDVRASRIAGRAVSLEVGRDSLQGEVDVTVSFNVDSLNVEAADKFMDWITKLSQADRGGNVDWSEVVGIAARMSNPDMARRIILPREVAAKRIAEDQNNRIAQMSAGVPMAYEEKQSAPELRLQVLQGYLQQPENQSRMQADPMFAEQMQNEVTYLQRQIQQYQENAVTGRTLMKSSA